MADGHVRVHVVTAALAYDDPTMGELIILILYQVISIPRMDTDLLCPMQMQINGVQVLEIPEFMATVSLDSTHTPMMFEWETGDYYVISLDLNVTPNSKA